MDNNLYRSDAIRACEREALQQLHLNDMELMHQAGTDAFFFMKRHYPDVSRIAVFCGSGNNAGDGYVVARLAHEDGLGVVVYQCKAIEDLPSTARQAALLAVASGVEFQSVEEPLDADVELIIDALLGIGLKGEVHDPVAHAIHQINSSGLPVLSIDVPSGLNADTGVVVDDAVKADATITFIAKKAGFYTADGPDYCGEIHLRGLQLDSIVLQQEPVARLLSLNDVSLPLPLRKKNSHKHDYGHVLVIGGGAGMAGAAALAARAALGTGAGMVTVATRPEHVSAIIPIVPEAMVSGIEDSKALRELLDRATVCILGPGLGEGDWALELYQAAMASQLPMVIDASALRLLAQHPQSDDNWILTPHPGEAAALLSTSSQTIQNDRFAAAAALHQQYGGVVVLKGQGTIIQTHAQQVFVCPRGNPGMASAGMGDVLSGILAGLIAQGLSLAEAAKAGVWVHATAGDIILKEHGEKGMLASDIWGKIPGIINGKV